MKLARKAFTLVEILIVVIILGILAAVVIPQMSNAMTEAKQSAVKSSSKEVVKAIELYRNLTGSLPDLATNGWTALTSQQTDIRGQTFGPLLTQGAPKNPLNGETTVANGTSSTTAASADAGWVYDYGTNGAGTGAIWATGRDKRTVMRTGTENDAASGG